MADLDIHIDHEKKKAYITFAHEVDLSHALRTEDVVRYDLYSLDNSREDHLVGRFTTEADALAHKQRGIEAGVVQPEKIDKVIIRPVVIETRQVVADDEVIRHALREGHAQWNLAMEAHHMPDADAHAQLQERLLRRREARPVITHTHAEEVHADDVGAGQGKRARLAVQSDRPGRATLPGHDAV